MQFPSETVIVRKYVKGDPDPYGAATKICQEEALSNVLVAPGNTDNLDENRPEGVEVVYTLYMPNTYTEMLEGADIQVRGKWYSVLGNPGYYAIPFCPTEWNRTVKVRAVDG